MIQHRRASQAAQVLGVLDFSSDIVDVCELQGWGSTATAAGSG